jgi:hypothetical protein
MNLIKIHLYFRVSIVSILKLGGCPCPICLVPRHYLSRLGTHQDVPRAADKATLGAVKAARNLIYKQGFALKSKKVQGLLGDTSLTPTIVSSSLIADLFDRSTKFISRMHSQRN